MRMDLRAILAVALLALPFAPLVLAPLAARAEAPVAALPEAPAATAEPRFRLLMIEQEGCAYCRMWNTDLGPIYPKTPEGQLAPLEHADLRSDWDTGLEIGPRPVFTPTFVLLEGNREVGRIEGYPGEDFFWGLLGMALRKAGADLPLPE